ncbi:MAG: 4a-hydroxytetrahydrobiopterin dehydratase [Stackebrandtia sp.]
MLQDAMRQLDGWSSHPTRISRTLAIDESQHADLTERIKIYADTLRLRPDVSRRDGKTQIDLRSSDGVTLSEVNFAARVEGAYRDIAGTPVDQGAHHVEPITGGFIRSWLGRRRH